LSGGSFYITTPIYYLNGSPHIGHVYTTVAADAAARWMRMRGARVRFLTGTDEHGQKVMEAAEKAGRDVKAHCDLVSAEFQAMMDRFDSSYDRFIRTTDDDHVRLVQAVLQHLFDRGEIYRDEYRGWYLVKDEVFVTEKEREEKIASGELAESDFRMVEESNWFFRMGKYQQTLVAHLEKHPDTVLPDYRRNEVLGFLKQPLGDLCISRPKARMSWGIELPFDRDYVCYVWFDALLNYLTGAGWTLGGDAGAWPADYQLLGKDILTTHAVYWTTMLLALGVPLPKHLYAHGWWVTSEGRKMSKSFGNAIDVGRLADGFGVDATRHFLLREIRFGADGAFSYDTVLERYNAELANDLGNLVHRALSMTEKWLGGKVPDRASPDDGLRAAAARAIEAAADAYDHLQFKDAIDAASELVRAGNKFVDTKAPWALNKAGKLDELRAAMRDTLEACAIAGVLLLPVMPRKARELLGRLAVSEDRAPALLAKWLEGERVLDGLDAGAALTVGDPLFPRFAEHPPVIAELFKEETVDAPLPEMSWIEYEDFAKIALRVGKVLEAGPHPNADKLLVLKVDLGEARPRTICAGLKAVFAPEALVGRNVVVVANLKPRVMRGVASEGMILAAGGEIVSDLVSADAKPGDTVR
jgi:methionyl-tRNA synthetase